VTEPSSTQLATLANIDDLVEGRDAAVATWLENYDQLHANADLAARQSIGGSLHLATPDSRQSGWELSSAFMSSGSGHEYNGHTQVQYTYRDRFEKLMTAQVDRQCWSHMMKHLGFDVLLDRQARDEFYASLQDTPPPFTADNCRATFGEIWGNRREMYLRGIANVFMAMDRRFRSHDAFAIGNRLIIERAFDVDSSWWNHQNRRDTLQDVERIFRELDGKDPIAMQTGIKTSRNGEPIEEAVGIVGKVVQARQAKAFPMLVQGEYFRVRVFQNGNLHLWFERKDLLAQVNALLLEYYKPIEGDVGEGPSYESAPLFHKSPAKNFGAFNSPPAVVAEVMKRAEIQPGDLVLEPSAGTGTLATAARLAGARVTCVEIQRSLAGDLRGMGFHDTTSADFLDMRPQPNRLYDRVVMNPPFDRGRDCDHVRHAYQFLKPGGRLVAVMSARAEFGSDARHKALHDLVAQGRNRWGGGGGRWFDLPEKSFASTGTNVNTVILVLEKPRT
jgi:protein-L-isoaspartate O-methyltransferase